MVREGRTLLFCLLLLESFAGFGQRDTLANFSKSRSIRFATQLREAKAYSEANKKSFFFRDALGNPVHLVGLTPSGHPVYWSTLNAGAAITTNVVAVRSQGSLGLNLEGETMVVGVWDGGRVKDHVELGERVIAKEGTTDDNHSTHVAGTLVASGINPAARGMAPLARATTHDFLNDEAEMSALAQTGPSSLLVSNHSYGTVTGWLKNGTFWEWMGDPGVNAIEDYRFGFYSERAQAIDQIAFLAPYYSIVWAAGNDRADVGNGAKPADCNGGSGYDCIIPEGVAKNVITVGAVNKVSSYSSPFDVSMSFFSSWGPTDDGRIKPDVVGDGVNLFSLSSNGTDSYTTMSGTSMSTPNVAGSLVLLQELYGNLHGGERMKAATLKALAIHTTKEAGTFPGPDYQFGWGLLDAGAAASVLIGQNDESMTITEGTLKNDSVYRTILHPKANHKMTATIAWTDPPANPVVASLDPGVLMLVNDLDMRITDDQGRDQLPWTLDPSNPLKQAARDDNYRDNVEKIEFDFPEQKEYVLSIRHKATLAGGSQDFSLIISYQAIQTVTTLYWIGDTGNWSDGSHWSTTSGGSPAMVIPGAGDHVVVDENSFDGSGTDEIALQQNAACAEFLWLNSRPGGLSLNSKVLAITSRWTVADPDFSIRSAGIINMGPTQSGKIVFSGNSLAGATLTFDGGKWESKGDFSASEVRINSGELTFTNSNVNSDRLAAGSTPGKIVSFRNTTITLKESSSLDGSTLFHSNGSLLTTGPNPVILQWDGVDFPTTIISAVGSRITVEGDNRLRHVKAEGYILLLGSNEFDTLSLEPGAVMELAPSSVQTLSSQTNFYGTAASFATLFSTGASTLSFPEHHKYCFDYIKVTQIQPSGNGVINAGTHSEITGADGWQEVECEDVLYADFSFEYNCVRASTEFSDASSGLVQNRQWNFGQGSAVVQESHPVWEFDEPGSYPVTLTVSGGGMTDVATKSVNVAENTLASNRIISNDATLTSFLVASRYQWYKDGLALPGETNRAFSWQGQEGVYYVVAYEGQCNIVSDTAVITGLNGSREDITVYPNPALDQVVIRGSVSRVEKISLKELTGKMVWEGLVDSELPVSVQNFPNGLYILEINSNGRVHRKKLVIAH